MKENIAFCPKCKRKVQYRIRKNIIEEYKGIKVNAKEDIGVCSKCNEDIFVTELETDNLKRLYQKYEEITGIKIKSKLTNP